MHEKDSDRRDQIHSKIPFCHRSIHKSVIYLLLLRIAQVYDIPIANNIATADFMIHSTLMNEQYSHQIENFKNTVDVRVKEMQ